MEIKSMAIKSIKVLNVMVFQHQGRKSNKDCNTFHDPFQLQFCDGINIFLGENGVGKTTLLKMIYAATQWSISQVNDEKTENFQKRIMTYQKKGIL